MKTRHWIYCWSLVCTSIVVSAAEEKARTHQSPEKEKPTVRREVSPTMTAVTMNYCRASFHRIRKNPSKRVMYEEQAKILNNLNLSGIGDEEVISMYTAVLDEVGQEVIAEQERNVIQTGYQRTLRQQALARAFVLGAEMGTAQYVSAVRTGANSWWDYRNLTANRDLDTWKVEKGRMLQVTDKSSKFLDTFWKLAQLKNIPDDWIVRGDDLDRLDRAITEPDPEVRLRVLQRMERFLAYYPPYWYHVGRTQQALGQLFAAAKTFEKLQELGHGHFRKDDMLAAALANKATIQAYLHQPGAVESARQALEYSNTCWQANLVCARILQQHQEVASAEEAILRNLDVKLEQDQSLTCLVSLYCETGEKQKLVARLQDVETVAHLPTVLLLQCAAKLGTEQFPAVALNQVVCTFYGYEQYGGRQLAFVVQPNWELRNAQVQLAGNEGVQPRLSDVTSGTGTLLRFPTPDTRVSRNEAGEVQVELKYPGSPPVKLHLQRMTWTPEMMAHAEQLAQRERSQREQESGRDDRDPLRLFTPTVLASRTPRSSYVITNVEVGSDQLALLDKRGRDPGVIGRQSGYRALPASLDRRENVEEEPEQPTEKSTNQPGSEAEHESTSSLTSPPQGMSLLGLPLKGRERGDSE